jgi:hypothetical protein
MSGGRHRRKIDLNMKSSVLDLSSDDAEGDQDPADLRKAFDSKKREIITLKSQLKDFLQAFRLTATPYSNATETPFKDVSNIQDQSSQGYL